MSYDQSDYMAGAFVAGVVCSFIMIVCILDCCSCCFPSDESIRIAPIVEEPPSAVYVSVVDLECCDQSRIQ